MPVSSNLRMYRLTACLLMISAVSLAAQTPASRKQEIARSEPLTTQAAESMFASYEGQNVVSIDLAGRPDLRPQQFESSLIQKAGEPFSKEKVNQTAAALKKAGHFHAVRIQVNPAPKGVRVLMILEPAVYIGVFQFPGAEQFAYSQLIQVANYPVQTPYDAREIERDQNRLLNFFRQQGYFQATVGTRVDQQPHHVANIVFDTKLGKKAKFGQVIIAGLPNDRDHHLENTLKGLLARVRLAAIRPGKAYHHSTITHARNYLQKKLADKGLLGAEVQLQGAEYHAETNRADIHFMVHPGVVTHVEIKGAHVWSWDKKKLVPMYQGIGVDQETVQEGRQALASYFQGKGYFDVDVDAKLETAPKADTVIYTIKKKKKHSVESVSVKGNQELHSDELTPHIAVQKEHLFSHGKFSEKLVRDSVKNLKGVYEADGFSSVHVAPTVKTAANGDIRVTFTVTEGPRDVVNSLTVEGADTLPASQYAPQGLKLLAGSPYSASNVNADRQMIVANYLRAGYLVSTFRETASLESKNQPHRINVVYHIYEGPRVSTGNVITLGRRHTQQRLIDRDLTEIKPDTPLTETELLSTGAKLYEHEGVFDWAEIDPKRTITTQTTEDVLVKVHESKRNEIHYGFGFEVINRGGSIPSGTVALPNLPPVGLPSNFQTSQTTFWGPRGTFQYTRNNIRGKGESFSFTAFAGRLDQRVAVYYIDPNFIWSPWRATPSSSYERNEENPIFSSQQEMGTYQIQRAIDKEYKNILFLRYGYSHTNLTRVLIPALVPQRDRNIRLSTLSANVTRDTRDNPLDEHHGVLDSIEFDFNTSKLGSNVDFAKLTGQAAFYKTKFHNIVWADSLRIGLAQPFASSFVPLSESFFTGGGNSLRGFPLDGAGPQNSVLICPNGAPSCSNPSQIRVPAGGNELLILNSEARIPLPIKKGLSIVPFYDGGNVFPRVGLHDFTSLYSNNVGIGFRYATPVGPIRLDIGHNLNPVSGIKSTQFFIGIGQAF